MGRVSVHLAVILTVVALVSMQQRPAAPLATPTPEVERSPVAQQSPPYTPPEGTFRPQLSATVASPPKAEKPHTSPSALITPQAYPVPTGVNKGVLQAPGISIRGLRLGMTQSQTRALYPGPEVVDRIKNYWGGGYQKKTRDGIGATWYQYNGFFASYDRQGVCGAVTGDGLERQGVPILAKGDSGADVERLLGKPNAFRCTPYALSDAMDWSYDLTDGSGLTVHFADGRVEEFEWRQSDFSDSGC